MKNKADQKSVHLEEKESQRKWPNSILHGLRIDLKFPNFWIDNQGKALNIRGVSYLLGISSNLFERVCCVVKAISS